MKHTPGPWEVGTRERGRFVVYAPKSNGRGICVMRNTQEWDEKMIVKYGEHPLNLEADLNAQLIAAAPDLLEACKCFVLAPNQEDINKAFYMARTAIAKAEGRE